MIATTTSGVIALAFSPLTSVVGHLCAQGDRDEDKRWFEHFYSLNYILGVVFFLGYYAVVEYIVGLLFGSGLRMSRSIAFIITLNQFTQYMRNTLLLFRNASGTFYYDRWKPVAEGVVNLILSLLFVSIFPDDYSGLETYTDGCKHINLAANVCGYTPINLGKIIKEGVLSDIDSIHCQTIDRAVEKNQRKVEEENGAQL